MKKNDNPCKKELLSKIEDKTAVESTYTNISGILVCSKHAEKMVQFYK